jgi:hypothetical protein
MMTTPKQRTEVTIVAFITLTLLLLSWPLSLVMATSNGAGACLATDDDVTNFKNAHGEALNPVTDSQPPFHLH